MRCLVTGGAGFIGHHLVEHLIGQGHDLTVTDIKDESEVMEVYGCNSLPFYYHKADIADDPRLCDVVRGIDRVYHLASRCEINNGCDFNRDTFETTKAVLNAMKECDVKELFFASTSAVYGEGDWSFRENDALNPISEYGIAKMKSEEAIRCACESRIMRAVVFRMANVVGPDQTHGVAFDFVRKLKDDCIKLKILGDGRQTKEYIFVDDVINAMDRVFLSNQNVFEIFNVSSGTTISVLEIADEICRIMGLTDVEYDVGDTRFGWEGDVPNFMLNTDKIESAGWKPLFDSRDAIRKSVAGFLK